MCQHLRAPPLCAKVLTRSESTASRVNTLAQSTSLQPLARPARPRTEAPSSPTGPSRAWAALARSRADALTRSRSPARASGARGPPRPPTPPSAPQRPLGAASAPHAPPTRHAPHGRAARPDHHAPRTTAATPCTRRLHPADKQPHFDQFCPVLHLILDTRMCYNKGVGRSPPRTHRGDEGASRHDTTRTTTPEQGHRPRGHHP